MKLLQNPEGNIGKLHLHQQLEVNNTNHKIIKMENSLLKLFGKLKQQLVSISLSPMDCTHQ